MIDKFNKLFSFQGFDSFILGYGFAHLVLDTTYWLGLIFIALSFAGAYGNARLDRLQKLIDEEKVDNLLRS